jgi:lysophospholipase L1-like esterase
VPDLGALAAYRGVDPTPLKTEVDRWNGAIGATVARHTATLVDLHAKWEQVRQHPEYVAADGFHPSAEGYQALADVFGEALDARPL